MVDFTFMNKYLDELCGDFYNPKKLLSFHRPLNIVQSSRSSGKTTSFAMVCVLSYILKGNKFFFMRRTQDETIIAARDLFNDAIPIIKSKYPEWNIIDCYYEAEKFILVRVIDGKETKEVIGRTMPLSMVYKRKSIILKDGGSVIIWFDEAVAVSPKEYLGSSENISEEGERLINFYQTVDRGIGKAFKNDTLLLLTANSTTLFCPIYIYLDAVKYIQQESKFIAPKHKLFCIERFDQVKATEDIEQSYGYRLSSNSEKMKMYHNDTQEWGGSYIGEKPPKSICLANIIFDKKTMGIWYSDYKCLWYIGEGGQADTYSLDVEGHENSNDLELCYGLNAFHYSSSIRIAYTQGRLLFKSYSIYRLVLSYLNFKL